MKIFNKFIDWYAVIAISFICFSIVFYGIYQNDYVLVAFNCIMLVAAFFTHKFISNYKIKIENYNLDKIFIVLLIIYSFIQFIFIFVFQNMPDWDYGWMYHLSQNAARGISFAPEHIVYMHNYPFNYSIILVYTWLFSNFTFDVSILFVLGYSCIMTSIVGIYLILKNNFTKDTTIKIILLVLLFYPYLSYSLIPYSDTLAMPFFIFAIYFVYKNNTIKFSYLSVLLLSITCAIGAHFKVLVLIVAIAYLMSLFLQGYKFKTLFGLFPFILFIIFNSFFANIVDSTNLSYVKYDQSGLTPLYWVNTGLNTESMGTYSEDDYNDSLQFGVTLTKEEDRNVNKYYIESIKERLNMPASLYFELAVSKTYHTWSNGEFGMDGYIMNKPLKMGATREFFTIGFGKDIIWVYSQLIYFVLLVGIFKCFSNDVKKYTNKSRFIKLMFIGFATYFMLFEAGPRYILIMSVLFFVINAQLLHENDV